MSAEISPRTVIEAFLPFSGAVALGHVYDGANLAGIPDQPLRLALRRLIAAGDVVQVGRGRAGTLTLTPEGNRRLRRDRSSLALAAAQDAGHAPWDGRWRLIAVTVPERDRIIRDGWRRELTELGAVAVSTSLYVSAHDILSDLHLGDGSGPDDRYLSSATTRDLNVRGRTDPQEIAEHLWPHAPVVKGYQALDRALRQDADDAASPAVLRQLRLADALENAMRHDPLLPPELRRGSWAPSALRRTWSARWAELQEAGGGLYSGWLDGASAPTDDAASVEP